MKPAFALSLSADGISLLYRAKDGWRSVGSTPFDTGDLPSALAEMRADAQKLAPGGVYSKLILPNDQIRYLSVETGDLPAGERIDAARRALEGATPYTVDQLAFDICASGSVTHVAAVALETLDEAETFAVEHGFGPVSFVAAPEESGFQGEPFFGTTRAIRGTEVEPDNAAIKVIGPVQLPEPAAKGRSGDKQPAPQDPSEAQTADQSDAPAPAGGQTQETPARPAKPEQPQPLSDDAPAAREKAAPAPHPATLPPATPAAAKPVKETAQPKDVQEESRPAPEPGQKDRGASPAPAAPPAEQSAPAPLAASNTTAEPGAAKPLGAAIDSTAKETAGAPRKIPPAPAALREASPAVAAPPPGTAAQSKKTPASKPRYLGVALTALLLLFLAAAAVWALLSEDGFFAAQPAADANRSPAASVSTGDTQAGGSAEAPSSGTESPADAIAPQVSALADLPDPGLGSAPAVSGADGAEADPTAEDEAAADGIDLPEEGTGAAFLDFKALQPGSVPDPLPVPLDELAQAARYAATGVWPVAPEMDELPAVPGLDELYTASVDRTEIAADAVALPQPESFAKDETPGAIASPAAAGAAFELDARGLVKATPEGTLNPDGITVYLGRPRKVPPPAPERSDPAAEALAEEVARNQVLSRKRPKARPEDLAEQVERAQNGGLSRAELASLRPRKRPASLKPAEEEELPATAQAIASSVVPRGRPANFANLVDRARRNAQNQVQTAAAVPAAAAAAPPRIPTSASVARRATVNNALNLRKLNLIGVFGTASNRRALVRLPSGRYKKVQVGDRIDGGRVIAIGESQLQYQKGGRNRTLTMPKS
ncbi:hypothetical protein KUV26_06980 [Leisingera daeponensis]|uniref:Translation initiation factor 2 n=1 Tax=Leisingera daeponensis TaxID=405746 RepID=A0ABS7NE92_9RHOB|nr:hypothetical protein [Leisingera daeponensis]MBY6139181.1 hypothetical protein [Leisingera daeponensis]